MRSKALLGDLMARLVTQVSETQHGLGLQSIAVPSFPNLPISPRFDIPP